MKAETEILIGTKDLSYDKLQVPDFSLAESESLVVLTTKKRHGTDLVDFLLGIKEGEPGKVTLYGRDPAILSEEERLILIRDVAHAGMDGDLISNLKVWENILLPADYHHQSEEELQEEILVEAVKLVGLDDQWMEKTFAALPDNLQAFERCLIGLLRAALMPSRLLICEFLFDDLHESEIKKLADILQWMKKRNPALAVLHVHHAASGRPNLDLTILGQPPVLFLKGDSDEIS